MKMFGYEMGNRPERRWKERVEMIKIIYVIVKKINKINIYICKIQIYK